MVFNHIHMNRSKGPKSDMEGNKAELDALFVQSFHEVFRKMETCRRRSSRSFYTAVDRLVTLTIFEFFMNIGRQRHGTQAIQNFLKDTVVDKAYDTSAEIRIGDDLTGKFITKLNDRTNTRFFPRFDKHFPLVFVDLAQEKDLDLPARLTACADEPCRNDTRIVEDQNVTVS